MWMYLLVLLLILDTLTFGILFEYRLRCPNTAEKWQENSDNYVCHGDTVYHCMQDQDGRYVVFCASPFWIQPDYCPEFNVKSSMIEVILCRGVTEKCPEKDYLTNTVHQYPSCFWTVNRITWKTKSDNGDQRDSTGPTEVITWIVVGIILPLPILVFLVIIFFVRRKRPKKYEKDTKSCLNYSKPDSMKREEAEILDSEKTLFLDNSTKDNDEEPRHEETFVLLRLYHNAVEELKRDGFIIIVGGSGSGKTTMANYILKKEFNDSTVYHMEPKQTTLPELKSEKTVVVVWDNCFGIWNICDLENNIKTNVKNTIIYLIDKCRSKKNIKALICVDPVFYQKYLIDEFGQNCVNLSANNTAQIERERFKNRIDRRIYIGGGVSNDVEFPLLIKLMVEHHYPIEKSEEFMKSPIIKLKENFYDLLKNERDVYVTLVYVLCNTPSVNQSHINRKNWKTLRDECEGKDKDNNDLQKDEYSQPEKDMLMNQNPKCIEINIILTKYLEKTENPDVFRFRHHFLACLLLCYHLENVGSKGILEVGNEEIKSVVKKLQSSLIN